MPDAATRRRPRRSGLFRRIFLTFLLTLIASAVAVGALVFAYANAHGPAWVEGVIDRVEAMSPELLDELHDPRALEQRARELSEDFDAQVSIHDRRGRLVAGEGPRKLYRVLRHRRRQLRHGRPVVFRPSHFTPPKIFLGLSDPDSNELVAVVGIDSAPGGMAMRRLLLSALALLLGVLAGGTYLLARSLTRRIGMLETSADRIAGGDVAHRVDVGERAPRDEIDQLGLAFNEMAEKIQGLLQGQRKLLANVSHELRTPVARIKVLTEILQERVDKAPENADPETRADAARIRKGLGEMAEDITEMEALIADLLTSGRLELRADDGEPIEHTNVALHTLLEKVAKRFDASCSVSEMTVPGDELLLQRVLRNVMINESPMYQEDGVIFEPFSRLDSARARDRGGAGLGLHLCQQIARAHGGEIRAEDRPGGRQGARIVVVLPKVLERP
jgi:signal transduction histidine kinase